MKKLILYLIASFYFLQIISSCASQQPVTGGAKDTIPPTLLKTSPTQKSLNFKGNEITLVFSEPIKENQLNSKLIITPDDQIQFETTIRKDELTLEFKNSFKDSTTYTLNFNGSIEDITEGNDAENVILAFSTTTYIDSLSIKGVITDMLTAEALPDITVALYQAMDTTHIFNKRPLYFTKTLKDGSYSLENLKTGSYRLYAFDDQNKNNLCESDIEKHGFVPDTLQLTTNLDSLNIPIIVNDVRQLSQITSRTVGQYFESRYNKSLQDYHVSVLDTTKLDEWNIYTSLTEDLRGITFYPDKNPKRDSLHISINATDSTNTTVTDSVYLKFVESSRNKPAFQFTVTPANQTEILPNTVLEFKFNKPIVEFNQDLPAIAIDTLFSKPLPTDSIKLSEHKNSLRLFITLNDGLVVHLKDSIKQRLDTLASDTTTTLFKNTKTLNNRLSTIKDDYTSVKLPAGSFISVDGDSSLQQVLEYRFIDSEGRGIVRGTVDTDYQNFTIQLIDSKYNTVESKDASINFEFKNIKPGEYSLRFLIDKNQDGIWTPGNSLRWISPEPVLLLPQFFNVRANWIMDNIEIEF